MMDNEMKDPYADEARERWGDTEAYKESGRRTKQCKPDDWARIKAEGEAVEAGMAELLRAGEPAEGPEAMDVAEQARLHIHRWFYPCSHRMHAGLADMYVADARFTAHYEERAPGLAAYVAQAIRANAGRHGG
ncbi:MAG: TipAS antibiotic-recognition domain-containing protein [Longimicrobiales bacterium]